MTEINTRNGDVEMDLVALQRRVRRSAHVQRAKTMLAAAGLATLGIVAVAGALLSNLF